MDTSILLNRINTVTPVTKETVTTLLTLTEIEFIIKEKKKKPGLYYIFLEILTKNIINYKIVMEILDVLIEHKDLKWRHLKLILPYCLSTIGKEAFCKIYYEKIFKTIQISSSLILGLAKFMPCLLKLYINEYVIIDKDFVNKPTGSYKINYNYLLNQIEQFIKKKFSQKGLDIFLKVFPITKHNLVFDGNNILLNKKGIIEAESFIKLQNLYDTSIKKGYFPLVFIHMRHLKTLKKMGLTITFNCIKTPYKYNDDWFSLYYAIKHNSYLVSKDIFRDHINQFDTLNKTNFMKIFLHHRKLDIKDDFTEIIFKETTVPVIIKEGSYIYIPGKTNYLKITETY